MSFWLFARDYDSSTDWSSEFITKIFVIFIFFISMRANPTFFLCMNDVCLFPWINIIISPWHASGGWHLFSFWMHHPRRHPSKIFERDIDTNSHRHEKTLFTSPHELKSNDADWKICPPAAWIEKGGKHVCISSLPAHSHSSYFRIARRKNGQRKARVQKRKKIKRESVSWTHKTQKTGNSTLLSLKLRQTCLGLHWTDSTDSLVHSICLTRKFWQTRKHVSEKRSAQENTSFACHAWLWEKIMSMIIVLHQKKEKIT